MVRSSACLLVFLATALPASAQTDWRVVSKSWREQLGELVLADAARRACDLPASRRTVGALRQSIKGLDQALGTSSAGRGWHLRAVVNSMGGKEKFCANQALMTRARDTLTQLGQDNRESGANVTLPLAVPAPNAPMPAQGLTPIVDPNIGLIQGCRKAVNARLGAAANNNETFWTTYETCVQAKGAGWF